jgi:hypothetical protein
MRLTLHYRGPLRSNGPPNHKHDLRLHFHNQLATLWQQRPLVEQPALLQPRPATGGYSLLRPLGPFTFVPLVTEEMHVIAELNIVLLRPEAPGGLLTAGGDMDNRLKTLLDAMTMPRHMNALPTDPAAIQNASQIFCLLEDDNLVTSMAIRTEQLLEPDTTKGIVDVTIGVRTRVTQQTMDNFGFD